ncbi:MAG TPA: OmpA family protein, partial [Turneriella sp.]|nr:OmpA family protein [Turneriella sp.]
QKLQGLPQVGSSDENEVLWRKAQNLGKPFNSTFDDEYPTVVRNGNYMYFASNRENGQGSFDVYRAKVPDFAKPEVVVTYKGRVKEKFSDKGIEANIRITDVDGERNFSTQETDGLYSADLVNKKQYKMVVTAPGYTPVEYIADLRNINSPVVIQKDFELERIVTLPKEATLYLTFVDEKGKVLKPQATYTLAPENPNEAVVRFQKNKGVLQVPLMAKYKNIDDAMAALQKMQLGVSAQKKGYADLHETRSLADALRGANGETLDKVELKFVMKEGEAPAVHITECKAGNGCVAIAYFSTNIADKLNNEKAAGLKAVVELWNKEPHKYVYVYGHTDSRGGASYNMKLSKARADFVKKRLVEYGIPAEMVITKAMGETQLANKNEKTDAGRRLNRRAEIYFDTQKRSDNAVIQEKAAPKTVKPKKNVKKKATKKKVDKKRKPLAPEPVEPSAKKPQAEDNPTPSTPAVKEESAPEGTEETQKTEEKSTSPHTEIKIQ